MTAASRGSSRNVDWTTWESFTRWAHTHTRASSGWSYNCSISKIKAILTQRHHQQHLIRAEGGRAGQLLIGLKFSSDESKFYVSFQVREEKWRSRIRGVRSPVWSRSWFGTPVICCCWLVQSVSSSLKSTQCLPGDFKAQLKGTIKATWASATPQQCRWVTAPGHWVHKGTYFQEINLRKYSNEIRSWISDFRKL